jgi:phosphatidylserine decarboxylase
MATDPPPNVAYLIGIDMNILNVHVNRSPIGGKIVLQKYIKGDFLSLRRPESETRNERVTTIIDNGQFKIAVIQIASRLVRRIVSYSKEGDIVAIGQRIGMIAFGSQVDAVIPQLENLKIAVKPGDRVRAGVSILARHGP